MTRIAFLGLGQMGAPMAVRLLEAGHELAVWNRSPEKASPLAERGARVAANPADAASRVDVAFTMLADPSALEQVLFGPDGLAAALGPGQVLVEMSTVGPDEVRSVAERLPGGVALVDAPVRGSVPQATDGSLIVLVGASDEDFERVHEILEQLGSVQRVGGPGAGAAMKLVANSTIGAVMSAVGEAIALGDALGLDRDTLLDVLEDTPIGSAVSGKRRNIETGSYPPNFKLRLALKDMTLVVEAAEAAGRELKVAAGARAWFEEAARRGAADRDYSAVIETILGP
jgi:3-hydroxyisobutyrate dehydrogenase-like beta-hydroxyacid dehydrogenase